MAGPIRIARQLREMGYRGELRATGNVLPDQLQFMLQVGFDTFEIGERFPLEHGRRRSQQMSLAYQRGLFRRGAEAEIWTERHTDAEPGSNSRTPDEPQWTSPSSRPMPGWKARHLLEPVLRDFAGRAAVVSSFGAESAVLLHMVAAVDPVHARDLSRYRQALLGNPGLSRQADRPAGTHRRAHQSRPMQEILRRRIRTARCTRPMPISAATSARHCRWQRALEGFDVVISGRKRFHGAARATLDFLSIADDRLKVEPLAGFSALDHRCLS